jgi:hypothetical protein
LLVLAQAQAQALEQVQAQVQALHPVSREQVPQSPEQERQEP